MSSYPPVIAFAVVWTSDECELREELVQDEIAALVIDPGRQRVTATITVGHRPQGIAVAGGSVWVTVEA